jgi:hypothetical protein
MMDQEYILGINVMPNVKQAVHLGIIRTNTLADSKCRREYQEI